MLISFLRRLLAAKRTEPPLPMYPALAAGGEVIFRLRAWPDLTESRRTAEIYRMLSVMSSQPVNRRWLSERCRMAPKQLDLLLQQLVHAGALEVIDPARYGRQDRARA